jgi:hypothetical protein
VKARAVLHVGEQLVDAQRVFIGSHEGAIPR